MTYRLDRDGADVNEGAVGVEMAESLESKHPEQDVTLIRSRRELLGGEPLPDDFKRKLHELVLEKGVKVILNNRVTSQTTDVNDDSGTTGHQLTLSNGNVLRYDMLLRWLLCTQRLRPQPRVPSWAQNQGIRTVRPATMSLAKLSAAVVAAAAAANE
jgi:hypothetical protein